ncbi:guided entry of tail-anchored proteins factor 4, partial [Homo sapiens]
MPRARARYPERPQLFLDSSSPRHLPQPPPRPGRPSFLPRCALGHMALELRWAAQCGGPRLTQGRPAENLAKVFSLMDPNSPERVTFVSRALKWSSGGSGKLGHPRLHQLLALTLWKEQNYCESRYHFLHSADGEGCANMLVEYSTSRGFRSEVDMFVA